MHYLLAPGAVPLTDVTFRSRSRSVLLETLPRVCQVPDKEVEFPGGRVPPALAAAASNEAVAVVIKGRGRGHLVAVEKMAPNTKVYIFSLSLLNSLFHCCYCLDSSMISLRPAPFL